VAQRPGPLRLTAHVFQAPEPVCMISGTLQLHFVLNVSIKFTFVNLLTQSGAT